MRLKNFIIRVSVLLCATAVSAPHSAAQQTTPPPDSSKTLPKAISLAQFINDALKEMKLPSDIAIPGLGDAEKILLKNFKTVNEKTLTASTSIKNIPFEVVKYTPPGKKPLLIIGIEKFDLSKSISGISGTPLGTLGGLENVAFIYSPEKFTGQLSSDPTIKKILGDASVNLSSGMNLIASVSTSNFSSELKELMKSIGVTPGKKFSFGGKISPNIFKNILKGSTGGSSGLVSSTQMKSKIQALLTDYGKDFLSDLDLSIEPVFPRFLQTLPERHSPKPQKPLYLRTSPCAMMRQWFCLDSLTRKKKSLIPKPLFWGTYQGSNTFSEDKQKPPPRKPF
tara:strand:+ start:345 stop:1358 length:1014 start_codon:yes stop_codon:yes gene_type:complete